jgi:hypothetical protein
VPDLSAPSPGRALAGRPQISQPWGRFVWALGEREFGTPLPLVVVDVTQSSVQCEAGTEARVPDIAASARGTSRCPSGAFIAYPGRSPAIDDACAGGGAMAARATSVGGVGRPQDRDATGEQNCDKKGSHVSSMIKPTGTDYRLPGRRSKYRRQAAHPPVATRADVRNVKATIAMSGIETRDPGKGSRNTRRDSEKATGEVLPICAGWVAAGPF